MILFVDDEPRRVRSFVEELEYRGLTVILAPSVSLAQEAMRETEISLVILDVVMPPGTLENTADGLMTGLELLREIRGAHPLMPIVLLTNLGHRQVEIPDKFTHVVHKADIFPAEFADFIQVLLKA